MSSKTPKKTSARSNGAAKRDNASGRPASQRPASQRPASKAAALTERAWKKTYENRGKSKSTA